MKFDLQLTDVKRSEIGEETEFQFENSAKMFKIIADGLYKNKIGSMIREVASNCYDSHVAAGKADIPFDLHLPDEYEPYISFRDYGIGMSPDDVKNIYTRVGKSTKENDLNTIGAFGLGSKTPFAYTDAFTVTSIHDGVKRTYTAFINERGIPAVGAMSEVATDECNGVEVMIPVTDTRHFKDFIRETREQLTFFTTKPNILNHDDGLVFKNFQAGQSNYLDVDGITVGDQYGGDVRGVWAVQGVVGYQVDVELLKQNLSPENQAFLDTIKHSSLINFKMGELEVIASREGISYNAKTFKAFADRLDSGRAALSQTVLAEVAKLDGDWNKAYTFNTNHTLARMANVCKVRLESPYYYRTSAGYMLDLIRVSNLTVNATDEIEVENDEAVSDEKVIANLGLTFTHYTGETIRKEYRRRANGLGKYVKADGNFYFLFRDTDEKPEVRIREWMYDHSRSVNAYVVSNKDGSLVTDAQKKEILSRIGVGFKNFQSLAAVPLPTAESRSGYGREGYKAPTAYTYTKGADTSSTRLWQRESLKLKEWTEGGYYVLVDRCNVSGMPNNVKPVILMSEAGLLDRPIVAIREKDAAKLDPKLWIRLTEKADEVIKEITASVTLRNCHALAQYDKALFGFIDQGVRRNLKEAIEAGEVNDKASPLHDIFRVEKTLRRLKERASNRGYNTITAVAFNWADVDINADIGAKIEEAVKTIETNVKNAYPLLPHMPSAYLKDANDKPFRSMLPEHKAHMIDYINLFDAKRAGV